MSILTLPSDRLSLVTNYVHLPSLIERFVEERLLALDRISVPVRLGSVLHNTAHYPPMTVPSNVVAILIKQPEIPATFSVEESPAGHVVKERESSRPAEYYVLFNSTAGGRSCKIEGLVELRYFYPRNPIGLNDPLATH